MGEQLRDAAREPSQFMPLPGAGHNDTYLVDPDLYFGTIATFIDQIMGD